MNKIYHALPTISFHTGTSYSHPPSPPAVIHLHDPALHVMTDLKQANAITIAPDATISEAAMEMRVCHTHLLLVVNHENNVVGLISSEDILGEKPLKLTQETRIKRADILVRMVMIKQENIAAIAASDLEHAHVGNVVKTLQDLKQHFALAVDVAPDTKQQTVRGLFSLSQISKQLGIDLTSEVPESQSLIDLQKKLGEF